MALDDVCAAVERVDMAKRALLIGCNYPGTEAQLQGCVNDVFNMKALYEECFGIEDFTILIDNDDAYPKPTGRQIKESLGELVAKTQPGDILVMHYSGHGTQVPSNDPDEEDMKDECLVPTDMNLLHNDDLREILLQLPDDTYFTFVSDCCHSGGMLDHHEVQITGPKDKKAIPKIDAGTVLSVFGMRSKGVAVDNVKNRSLPTDQLMALLGVKAEKEVDKTNVRDVLGDMFGDDASKKVKQYVSFLHDMLGGQQIGGFFSKLGSLFGGGKGKHGDQSSKPPPEMEYVKPGHKPPNDMQLSPDVGVLITGCQAHETSADACPEGDPKNAYGALSNAIQTVVRANYKKSNRVTLSNADLVYSVRKLLADGSYGQNPCLECSQANAGRVFITGATL